MNCKKCDNEFEPKKGLLNYCSLQCRNSRTWTDADKEKKSIIAKNSTKLLEANKKNIAKLIAEGKLFPKIWYDIELTREENYNKRLLELDVSTLKFETLRKRIILEQNGACNKCKLNTWQGFPIMIEIDHIDGNNKNNERINLEGLCPNCHSITPTWRGRNKTNTGVQKISDKDLLESLLKHNFNFRQALIEIQLAPKGNNYNRCHRLKREYLEYMNQ